MRRGIALAAVLMLVVAACTQSTNGPTSTTIDHDGTATTTSWRVGATTTVPSTTSTAPAPVDLAGIAAFPDPGWPGAHIEICAGVEYRNVDKIRLETESGSHARTLALGEPRQGETSSCWAATVPNLLDKKTEDATTFAGINGGTYRLAAYLGDTLVAEGTTSMLTEDPHDPTWYAPWPRSDTALVGQSVFSAIANVHAWGRDYVVHGDVAGTVDAALPSLRQASPGTVIHLFTNPEGVHDSGGYELFSQADFDWIYRDFDNEGGHHHLVEQALESSSRPAMSLAAEIAWNELGRDRWIPYRSHTWSDPFAQSPPPEVVYFYEPRTDHVIALSIQINTDVDEHDWGMEPLHSGAEQNMSTTNGPIWASLSIVSEIPEGDGSDGELPPYLYDRDDVAGMLQNITDAWDTEQDQTMLWHPDFRESTMQMHALWRAAQSLDAAVSNPFHTPGPYAGSVVNIKEPDGDPHEITLSAIDDVASLFASVQPMIDLEGSVAIFSTDDTMHFFCLDRAFTIDAAAGIDFVRDLAGATCIPTLHARQLSEGDA
ncbi:MAG: hypothetical protein ABFR95_04660 [Actinomycetota bacterium]